MSSKPLEKDALISILGTATAYYPDISKALGDVAAGVFVSRIFYWTSRGKDPDGWIYKKQEDIEEETGLTLRNQQTARRKARELGVLEEKLAGVPATVHYRLNLAKLSELLNAGARKTWRDADASTKRLEAYRSSLSESDNPVDPNHSLSESDKLDCPNQTNQFVQVGQTSFAESDKPLYTLVTQVDTSIDTTGGDIPVLDLPAPQPVIPPPPANAASEKPSAISVASIVSSVLATPIAPVSMPADGGFAGLVQAAKDRANGAYHRNGEHARIDGLQQRVAALELTPAAFTALVNTYLELRGQAHIANGTSQWAGRTLTDAQEFVVEVAGYDARFTKPAGLRVLFKSWEVNNPGLTNPGPGQLLAWAKTVTDGKAKTLVAYQNGKFITKENTVAVVAATRPELTFKRYLHHKYGSDMIAYVCHTTGKTESGLRQEYETYLTKGQ